MPIIFKLHSNIAYMSFVACYYTFKKRTVFVWHVVNKMPTLVYGDILLVSASWVRSCCTVDYNNFHVRRFYWKLLNKHYRFPPVHCSRMINNTVKNIHLINVIRAHLFQMVITRWRAGRDKNCKQMRAVSGRQWINHQLMSAINQLFMRE